MCQSCPVAASELVELSDQLNDKPQVLLQSYWWFLQVHKVIRVTRPHGFLLKACATLSVYL